MNNSLVALIEIGGSHDECLYFQVNTFIANKIDYCFIADDRVIERNPKIVEHATAVLAINTNGKAIGDFLKMIQIKRFLLAHNIRKVVFNTAQGGHIRNLALILPKQIACYGFIHTIRKFSTSKTQRIIDRCMKKYAVLSDDLLRRIAPNAYPKQAALYALEFDDQHSIEIPKNENETWLALTGGVENRRKDLVSIVSFMQQAPTTKWIFLGKTNKELADVQEFLAELAAHHLTDRVVIFDTFLSNELFFSYLKKCDFIIPLIHENTASATEYINHQISGAFNLSFAYHIPLLIQKTYESEEDLKKAAFFYTNDAFQEALNTAINNYAEKKATIAGEKKWSITYQRSAYLDWLDLNK